MENTTSKKTLRLATSIDIHETEKRKKVPRTSLINLLNRINFKNGEIAIQFKHRKYSNLISLAAKPQTCNDTFLEILWSEPGGMKARLKFYELDGFNFSDGLKQVKVYPRLVEISDNGLIVELPEYGYETKLRAIKRHACRDVSAQISQDGSVVAGVLVNFCAESFTVKYRSDAAHLNVEFNPENPANVVMIHREAFIFSGKCKIIRQERHAGETLVVLKPDRDNIKRMRSKEYRTERLVLSPLPNLIFRHPLTQKKITIGVCDISGLGFSVEEDIDSSVLLPGLIIPELEIEFIHGFTITCKAQVLYRLPKEDVVRCGMMILDMNMQDHVKLSSLIHKAKNKYSYISSTNVDLDALWDFFFESGFVYPEKYIHIAEQKDKFISIYKKLYNENPEIARHVIYQERGKIYGHVSMFRYYQKTWLLHHHAAVKSSKHKAGLVVMDHILQYINELHSLPSARMKYIGCYFRPNNRFANRVFGASSRALNDLAKSSLDEFAYLHLHPDSVTCPSSSSLTLCETNHEELEILQKWYDEVSGGLMINALDLTPEMYCSDETICDDYLKAGFKRERKLFSLKKDDELMAVLIVNISDFGLNMSDLTNCIQFFVLDEDQLNKNMYNFALAKIAEYYEHTTVPVLLYPRSSAEILKLTAEKTYVLGLLNLNYMNDYLQFIESLTTPKRADIIKQVKQSL